MSMSATKTKLATGKRINRARRQAGYPTIRSFAEALNVNYSQVVRWESGTTTPRKPAFEAIAEVCGTSVERLLGQRVAA